MDESVYGTRGKHLRLILCALVLLISPPVVATEISGKAVIEDGNTIKIGNERIRLYGIDAPEKKQQCVRAIECYPCGTAATEDLAKIVGDFKITCQYTVRDQENRIIGECFNGWIELGPWLIFKGWAVAYRTNIKEFFELEADARENGRGIWQGEFITPAKWREGERLACER